MLVQGAPTRGAPRGLRGATLAGTSAALSVAAHAAAGGSLPGPGTTALLTALLAAAASALADRKRGLPFILGTLGLSQLALHYLLHLTAAHPALGSAGTQASMHPHHGAGAHGLAGVQHVTGMGATGMPFNSTVMTLGHIGAALLTGLVLAGAEDALFLLIRVLGWALPRQTTATWPITVPLKGPIPSLDSIRLVDLIHRRIHAPRGPPRVS